ncbi:hypothetical protein [Flaviaesturariibacter aridisoli]|uniref:Uncharacterized protein n=1 Tax=Flaviaesturariibacter aridisoli TaxID=2545761 RepID=A0A4R4E3B4_9BACT|nr:hypothetical protein [Flaviaesturariibacter aridisoli]TCZ70507.1 hypothetical protein E0486_11160 [Flaviaesturariibacter aridisoli]
MPTNKAFQAVPATLIESTRRKIQELLEEWRPYFVHIDPAERDALPKMSDKSLPFAQKSLELSRSQPRYLPPFVETHEFENDMANVEGVTPVFRQLQQLVAGIGDLLLVSNGEAYATALAIYAQVKLAAERQDDPEARSIAADMGKRYPGRKRKAAPDNA